MSKPHPPEDFYNGVAMRDLFVTMSRALDHSPKEVEALHRLAIKRLHKNFPKFTNRPEHELMAAIHADVVGDIERSAKAKAALDLVVERYGKLPSTETIRLAKDGHNSIVKAVIVGLIIGAVIVGTVILYRAAKYS